MKLRYASVAALSLVAACATQKGADSEPQATATVEVEKNAPPPPVQLNTVQGDGFTVKMPGTPQPQRSQVQLPAGQATTGTWSHEEGGVIYSLTYVDYPPQMAQQNPPQAFLNEAKQGIVNRVQGTLSNERDEPVNGFPGERFTVDAKEGNRIDARSAIVNNRLYSMLVVYNPAAPARAADEFLSSLQVEAQATGGATGGGDGGTSTGMGSGSGSMSGDGGTSMGAGSMSGGMDGGTMTGTPDAGTRSTTSRKRK